MKKILVNAYINLNFGDDLFLKILFDRYQDVQWVISKAPSLYKNVFENYKNVEVRDGFIYKVKNKLKIKEKNTITSKYDAGIYIGGSIFMQLPEWKDQLQERYEVIESFLSKNKPYFVLGSNFGPYTTEEFVKEYKNLLSRCTDVCFRDNYSYEIFKDYDIIRKAPDIVFQLKMNTPSKIKNSIGISIIDLNNRENLKKYNDNYLEKIKKIIEEAINKDKHITLFSFCKAEGDLYAINQIVNVLDYRYKQNIEILNYDGNIDEFLYKFSQMENIIGSRFHACILSQVFGQGLYPIIYSDKTYNVLEDINLNKEYIYIKDIDKLDEKHVLDIISNNKIKNKQIFKEAEKQFERLDTYVNGK